MDQERKETYQEPELIKHESLLDATAGTAGCGFSGREPCEG